MKQFLERPYGYQLLLLFLGVVFFIPFLGSVHLFDWDEINFAESSREMLVTGNYFQVQVNYEPFMEKPPFFFWLQALSMSVFGVNEFAARFPNAIIGIIALLVLFGIGKRLHNKKFGMIWALVYLASFLPHLYYKSGIIDPGFNLFIFTSIYFLVRLINGTNERQKNKFSILSGLFIGLAIVTKGPVGLLLLMLTFAVYWGVSRFRRVASLKHVGLFILTILITTSMWYGYEIAQNGPWFLIEFIKYQIELFSQPVAGHEQPFYYHFVVVLIGCFPLSIFALPWFGKRGGEDAFEFQKWMTILFWVVMILFTIVSTKIVHYSSMAYLPLSYLAAKFLFSIHLKEINVKKWILIVVGFFGFIFSALLTLTPLVFMNKDSWLLPNIDDPFAQYQLDVEFSFMGWEFLIGIAYFVAIVFSLIVLSKQNVLKSMLIFALSTGVCLSLFLKTVVPQVEKVSQLPQIEFLEEHAEEDAYITCVAMKSYAHFFYGKVMPLEESDGLYQYKQELLKDFGVDSFNDLPQKEKASFNTQVEKWHYEGPIDKPTYLILRAHQDGMSNYPECQFLYRKGGYTFYKRMPK